MSLRGYDAPVRTGADLVRLVRALGGHRYVASRRHDVHAFVWIAATAGRGDDGGPLAGKCGWAERVLGDGAIERASKDERLYTTATDAELVLLLESFWERDGRARAARVLSDLLSGIGVALPTAEDTPFDEAREADVFPVLVDAGWELLPLARLDEERHKGAIAAMCVDDDLGYASARFNEESAAPPPTYLVELPALGACELLLGVDAGGLVTGSPAVFMDGPEAYVDYVHRGVLRAAKLDDA